jgi:hypothetical protein
MKIVLVLLAIGIATIAPAADYPSAEISNGTVTAQIYLPDAEEGYYRGNRFDWSGAVYSLTYGGHEYFGEWQDTDDLYLHDHITGPVEEHTTDGEGLGYGEAEVGGSFVRIGAGSMIKPEEEGFDRFKTYEVKSNGEWFVERGPNWIEFTHELIDTESGYGYRLTKRMTLTPGRPELLIDHTLTNLGRKGFETTVYNHNFFVIDGQPTGPDFSVKFPFKLAADNDMRGIASIDGSSLTYQQPVPAGENVLALLSGYGDSADDHAFTIENSKVKAGVRLKGDKPISRIVYWSPTTTLCPEQYVDIRVDVGQSDRWTLKYEFYTIR